MITAGQGEEDEEELWQLLSEAVNGAMEKFVEQRTKEGEHLKLDLIGKLDAMTGWVGEIEKRSPAILIEYRKKLEDKVNELLTGSGIDENRIAAEVTLFADKICVDEETVRLRSHIGTMKSALLAGGAVGRKLDFIAQEMNREANTILSKANDLEISGTAHQFEDRDRKDPGADPEPGINETENSEFRTVRAEKGSVERWENSSISDMEMWSIRIRFLQS